MGNRYSGSPIWRPGIAKQIVNSINAAPEETGIIPTAGVGYGGKQFMNFMSIKTWDNDGQWTTNYSALAVSSDNGESWGVLPRHHPQARSRQPELPDGRLPAAWAGGSVPVFLRNPKRASGSAYVARVAPALVPDLAKYEYFNADTNSWVPGNPAAATPVIPGPVSEMSAQFNTYLKQYLVMCTNRSNDVVMRTAPAPQGRGVPSRCWCRRGSSPAGCTGRSCIRGRRARTCTTTSRCGRRTT